MVAMIVDGALLALLLIVILNGIKKGFVKSFVGLFKNIAAFLLTLAFSNRFAEFIGEKYIKGFVTDKFSVAIADLLIDSGIAASGDIESHIPGFLLDMLRFSNVDVDEKIIAPLEESIAANGGTAEGIAAVIAEPITDMIAVGLSFIILYVVFLIALTLAARILDKLCELPVLKTANGILGGVLGAVCGVIYLWIASKVIVFLVGIATGSGIEALAFLDGFKVEDTFVLRLFHDFNPLKAALSIAK